MMSLSGMPMGISMSPVFLILPVRAMTLVPLLFSEADRSIPLRTVHDDGGILAKVSTLLITVGLPHKPLLAGKGGLGRGMPRSPSMEAIKAVSSPQTKAPAPSLTLIFSPKSLSKSLSPRKPLSSACFKSKAQPVHRQRVFGANIDITEGGADGIGADDHSLNHRVGVALDNGAIHKSTGIPLVGIADDVSLRSLRRRTELPFGAGGKAAATPPRNPEALTTSNNLCRAHGCKAFSAAW
jgi:hypothetical protein